MTRSQKRTLARIIISAVLLIAALIVNPPSPINLIWFLVAYAVIGYDVLLRAGQNIAGGQVFDEHLLMAIATIGVFVLAAIQHTSDYDEAVMVMLLYQVGELFQSLAVGKSRRSVAELMDIRPDYANIERDGEIVSVDPDEVEVGTEIVVRPGEQVPIDGVITQGDSALDTARLTGESVPREVSRGCEVISGCINLTGVIRVCTTKPFGESTVARILDLVENSGSVKAKAENFITRFAKVYTPIVVFAALALAVIPGIFTGEWTLWIGRALIFLVASCPCALVISVPLSFFGGIGGASRKGILVKGANYLEALADARTVVFDKTGTLTKGSFAVTSLNPAEGTDKEELLETAALAQSFSSHPIAASLKEAYGKPAKADTAEDLSGRGVHAKKDGHDLYAGNARLMKEIGAEFKESDAAATIVYVAKDGKYLGFITIEDEPKDDAKEAIQALRDLKIDRTVMLTGDRRAVAEKVAARLGLSEYHAELLPQDKTEQMDRILSQKRGKEKVAFVGDGINDAPTLARADIGIAMGALGSDAAIEAADVVLMNDRPSDVAQAVKTARHTVRIVRENVVFALGVKCIVLVLAALGLVGMWAAVFADVGVTILAVLNAMRCLSAR